MDNVRTDLAEKLKSANNVLVTVSRNPSVDQLAACLGLTLLLNKMNKHAAAVFSGEVPSTIDFLKPEDTLEKTTDSLRDFIIALDKTKADKLRYKVEDNVVRIFITPYKTSITEDDLEFSQGDFNVDVVVALGVAKQEDLDEAVVAHGRILHDATVASITTNQDNGLGSINWHEPQSSSLCELVTELAENLGKDLIDNQIATALMTGIVAETDRFSNDKTSAQTMSASATLMKAGANQQLVATQLQEPTTPDAPNTDPVGQAVDEQKSSDGTLEINHEGGEPEMSLPTPQDEPETEPEPEPAEEPAPEAAEKAGNESLVSQGPKLVTEPPALGGQLTANSQVEPLDPSTDPFSLPSAGKPKILNRPGAPSATPTVPAPDQMPAEPKKPADTAPEPLSPPKRPKPEPIITGLTPPPPAWVPPVPPQGSDAPDAVKLPDTPTPEPPEPVADNVAPSAPPAATGEHTLADLEASVNSPHAQTPVSDSGLDAARDEVSKALAGGDAGAPPPIEALNAQPMVDNLNSQSAEQSIQAASSPSLTDQIPGLNPVVGQPTEPPKPVTEAPKDPNAPPPVPPPIPFQFGSKSDDKK
jgi:hypothetical protein